MGRQVVKFIDLIEELGWTSLLKAAGEMSRKQADRNRSMGQPAPVEND